MIRIGIVGCGRILAAHLRGYRLLREAGVDTFRIAALCSRRIDDARMYVQRGGGPTQRPAVSHLAGDPLAIGDEYLSDFQPVDGVRLFDRVDEMLAHGGIDAINDFTSHDQHHLVGATAIAAGKHLLTQKPLAVSVRAGQQLCERAERQGVVFGVFENFRFTPATRQLRWVLAAERLGALEMAHIGYVGAWWAPDRVVAQTPWRHVRKLGGGISLDLGVHFFDQLRYISGEVKTVQAQTATIEPRRAIVDNAGHPLVAVDCDADDTCMASFTLDGGACGTLLASWAGHGAPATLAGGSAIYARGGQVAAGHVTRDGEAPFALAEWYAREASQSERDRAFPLGLTDSFALAQLDWLEAVRHERPPETDGSEGLRDLAAAFAILESAHAGRRVSVEDVLAGRLEAYQEPINRHFQIEMS